VRATVTLVPVAGDLAVRTAETDATGRFAIDGVPAGRWDVEVEAPGHVPAANYVLDATGARSDLELRVRRGGAVAGLVVDPAGSPVAGATLVLRRQGGDGPLAAASPAPSTPGRVRWVHPLAGPRQMPFRDSRRFGAARDGTRPAECGRGHCGVDLGGVRGSTVHAAADGVAIAVVSEIRPRAGRFVMLEHAGGLRTFYMHLDEVRGDLVPGQSVRAGEPIGTLGRSGVIKSGPHLHFALAQEDRGRTWYIDPEPMLQQAIVLAAPAEATGIAAGAVIAQALVAGAAGPVAAAPIGPSLLLTDGTGRFRVEGLAPGRYVATAFHAGLAPGASDPFDVASGRDVGGMKIELSPGVIVHGRVLGPHGPVAGARISAEEGLGESVHSVGKTTTDAAGRFELRPLAGSIALTVTAVGFGSAERQVELATRGMASARREEDFELAVEDAALAGQVVDAMGMPVRGATVRIADGPVRGRRAVSDAGGRFLIPALPAGRYDVEVLSPDHPPVRAAAGTDDAVRVALVAGGSIRVAVVDRQTRGGLAGARIAATGPDGARASAVTDGGGRAELRALATGRWRLRGVATGFAAAERAVDIAARGQEATLELSRGALLAGVVRDRNGDRVAGARVSVGDATTTTDQNGAFRLSDVPSGRVVIECESEDRRGEQSLHLAPGDELVTLELRL
jgi:murein DD-endopeptidase MepM/ murein hydrolase activator NlpD